MKPTDPNTLALAIARLNRQHVWNLLGAALIGALFGALLAAGYLFEQTGGWR